MKILFIGDIVGRPGRRAVQTYLPQIKDEHGFELVVANAENAAGGFGLTHKVADELHGYGVDCMTMGNHTWHNKDIFNFIDQEPLLIRPLNYLPGVPGKGWTVVEKYGIRVAVVNLIGQAFMGNFNSPLMVLNEHLAKIKSECDLIVIDFHAEATGEKLAFANYFDGNVACVVGTHTHVQTADAKILPRGTAYITDLGLTGAIDSILGMKKEKVIDKYITQLPGKFEVASGPFQLAGAVATINERTGLAEDIKAVRMME